MALEAELLPVLDVNTVETLEFKLDGLISLENE
jgi:hypothetical protein